CVERPSFTLIRPRSAVPTMAKRCSWWNVEQFGSSASGRPSPLLSMPSSHEPHSGLSTATSNTQPRLGTHSLLVQMSLSSQMTGPPPVQVPSTQVEFSVQRFPSSHVVPFCLFGCVHMPDLSHWSAVQTLPSSAHGEPGASNRQVAEQQSPGMLLPSSHSSG